VHLPLLMPLHLELLEVLTYLVFSIKLETNLHLSLRQGNVLAFLLLLIILCGRVTMEDFRRAVSSVPRPPPTPSLQDILQGEDIIRSGILNDPQGCFVFICFYILMFPVFIVSAELIQQMPAEQQAHEQLESTLRSPQLQQAIGSLNDALRHPENFHGIATNFNLDPTQGSSELGHGDGVGAFMAAISVGHPALPESKEDEKNDDTKMEE
jgi:Na+-transporting methylmalonyl-CoA/oxaloacetate decarboxylase gamma subunit